MKKIKEAGWVPKRRALWTDNVWFDSMTHVYGLGKIFVQIPRTQNNIGSCLSLYAVDGSHNDLKTQTNKDKYGSIRTIRANKFTIFSTECFLWTYFILMLTYMSILTHICPYLYLIVIFGFQVLSIYVLNGSIFHIICQNYQRKYADAKRV